MRVGSRFRMLVQSLVVSLVSMAILVVPSVSAEAAASCPNIAVIGAAGSGENDGVGKEVRAMVSRLQSDLGSVVSIQTFSIGYPAASTSILVPSKREAALLAASTTAAPAIYYATNARPYFNSVDNGVADAKRILHTIVARCAVSGTKIILAGYSQGSLVMHRAINQLSATGGKDIQSVVGVLLLADPAMIPTTATNRFGTAPSNSQGVESYLNGVLHMDRLNRDVSNPSIVASICDQGDIVCNFDWTRAILPDAAGIAAGIHTSYLNHDGSIKQAVDWIAAKLHQPTGGSGGDSGPGADAITNVVVKYYYNAQGQPTITTDATVRSSVGIQGTWDGTIWFDCYSDAAMTISNRGDQGGPSLLGIAASSRTSGDAFNGVYESTISFDPNLYGPLPAYCKVNYAELHAPSGEFLVQYGSSPFVAEDPFGVHWVAY